MQNRLYIWRWFRCW